MTTPPAETCRRAGTRAAVARPSTLRAGEVPLDVTVEDLSRTGFCFSSAVAIPEGTAVRVGLAGAGRAAAEVTWRRGERHGCVFRPALARAQVDAAFGDATVTSLVLTPVVPAGRADQPTDQQAGRDSGGAATGEIALPIRLALMALAGGCGWAALAMAGRHLFPFWT